MQDSNNQQLFDGIESYTYRRQFLTEELDEMRIAYIDSVIEQRKIADQIKALTAQKKKLMDENSSVLNTIVEGSELITEDVGFMDDYDTRERTYYDANGTQVGQRKLRSTEVQNVHLFPKAVHL